MTLAPGTRLASDEIVGALGAGGVGEVYRANDTRLGRSLLFTIWGQVRGSAMLDLESGRWQIVLPSKAPFYISDVRPLVGRSWTAARHRRSGRHPGGVVRPDVSRPDQRGPGGAQSTRAVLTAAGVID